MEGNEVQRPEPGTQFTTMTTTGAPTAGILPVNGTTVDDDGAEEWTGVFVLLDEEKRPNGSR